MNVSSLSLSEGVLSATINTETSEVVREVGVEDGDLVYTTSALTEDETLVDVTNISVNSDGDLIVEG